MIHILTSGTQAALRRLVLLVWRVLLLLVVINSLAPAAYPVLLQFGSSHISDSVLHFGAYFLLSFLPVIGFARARTGILWGLSMFFLGIVLEGAKFFSPGRFVEFTDVLANNLGVACGAVLGSFLRALATGAPGP